MTASRNIDNGRIDDSDSRLVFYLLKKVNRYKTWDLKTIYFSNEAR